MVVVIASLRTSVQRICCYVHAFTLEGIAMLLTFATVVNRNMQRRCEMFLVRIFYK